MFQTQANYDRKVCKDFYKFSVLNYWLFPQLQCKLNFFNYLELMWKSLTH